MDKTLVPERQLRAAVIVDDGRLAKWQLDALDEAAALLSLDLVLDCTNTQSARNLFRHGAYYALNLISLRNPMSHLAPFDWPTAQTLTFDAEWDGNWQKLPPFVLEALRAHEIDIVIKFGKGLLRITPEMESFRVLSFHHGDPEHFRGRPAGFWEIAEGADRVGLIVQELSNRLDAGKIWARAYSKIVPHSYRATSQGFYKASRYLLRKALQAIEDDRPVMVEPTGRNYRLPGNMAVLRFALHMLAAKVRRLARGLCIEQRWMVAEIPFTALGDLADIVPEEATSLPVPKGYTFLADSFFAPDGRSIYAEAMSASTGLGHLFRCDPSGRAERVVSRPGHHSYPYAVEIDGKTLILPETASHSAPAFYSPTPSGQPSYPLQGLENERVHDPSILMHGNRYYLFGGRVEDPDHLFLWVADSAFGPYRLHPRSPVSIDPAGSRMGGRLAWIGGRLYRFGQDNRGAYGRGLVIFEIDRLDETEFSETRVSQIAFDRIAGPHTLDVAGDRAVVDYYRECLSPLAAYRRIAFRVARMRGATGV